MQGIPEGIVSIKQAAELTGLTEDTIRFYERIGLLPYADRKPNGHRAYSEMIQREISKLHETQKIISYFDMPKEWAATLRSILHKA